MLVAQSCLTLYNSMDSSPPGPSMHGILQARLLEWVAISFSMGSSQPRDQTRVSDITDTLPSELLGKPPCEIYGLQLISSILWVVFSLSGHCPLILNIFLIQEPEDTYLLVQVPILIAEERMNFA